MTTATSKVIHWNGETVAPEEHWLTDEVRQFQTLTQYQIDGKRYSRIPFGEESPAMSPRYPKDTIICTCCAYRTQLHLSGCDYEQCPACGGQRASCSCPWDEAVETTTDGIREANINCEG